MAQIKNLAPKIARWEGGYVNDKTDRGGATNMGVTLGTWRQIGYDKDGDGDIDAIDIKLLNTKDFEAVLRQYWNRWQADKIVNQSIAEILVDWVWGSGKWGIIIPQRLLGLEEDGVVGAVTLLKINSQDPETIFKLIFEARVKFLKDIVKRDQKQAKFIKGWLNRLSDFKFSK
ncbi:peptidoglycan domain protein [Flavobacterium phage FPSV-S1]|nr:peptidoglycan domain protein [Flavobacterium phage FPSV-S1]QCW20498.1 peptidoglycan domain protein [Flavobacterium phage FPSV-S8]